MVGVVIPADQAALNILEGIPLSELVKIDKSGAHQLSYKERRVIQVKKNKIYKHTTLKKQMNNYFFEELTRNINKAKIMNFVTVEPECFHPYLVAEFYRKTVIASDSKSFKKKVFGTQFIISAQFLAKEFDLSSSGMFIFT